MLWEQCFEQLPPGNLARVFRTSAETSQNLASHPLHRVCIEPGTGECQLQQLKGPITVPSEGTEDTSKRVLPGTESKRHGEVLQCLLERLAIKVTRPLIQG